MGDKAIEAWSGQGWIYRNPKAFYHTPAKVCYVHVPVGG